MLVGTKLAQQVLACDEDGSLAAFSSGMFNPVLLSVSSFWQFEVFSSVSLSSLCPGAKMRLQL